MVFRRVELKMQKYFQFWEEVKAEAGPLFRWAPMRSGAGGWKLRISPMPVLADGYILWYDVGANLPKHLDPSPAGHLRLNITLREADEGGIFQVEPLDESLILRRGKALLFRPDWVIHEVTPVTRGRRVVLSIGAALPRGGFLDNYLLTPFMFKELLTRYNKTKKS